MSEIDENSKEEQVKYRKRVAQLYDRLYSAGINGALSVFETDEEIDEIIATHKKEQQEDGSSTNNPQ